MRRTIVFWVFISLLCACGPKPPAGRKPLTPPKTYYFSPTLAEVSFPDRWWETLGDPLLNRLVSELLTQNLDLLEASRRLEEARARVKFSRAARFPRLDFSFRGDKQRTVVLAPYFRGGGYVTGRFTGSLAASYEVDLWKRLSRAEKAARLSLLAAEEDRLALAQSLVAELVSRYLEARYLSCQLEATQKELEAERAYLRVLGRRYAEGLVSASVLEQEKRLLAGLEIMVPELEERLLKTRQEISLLLGRYPAPLEVTGSCALDLPPPPPGLPSELLLRRPDVRAARARVLSAAEEVAVKQTARFPHLTLTATEGRLSNALKNFLTRRHRFWELAFSLTQPIFDAGALRAEKEAAQARFRQAEATYARTVLQAFFEVETGLLAEEKGRERWRLRKRQEEAAQAEEEILRVRYEKGMVEVLDYLKAKHLLWERRRERLAAELSLLLNRVSLYRALGGSWPAQLAQGEGE